MIFEKPGKINTQDTVSIALACARERNIGQIVIASNSGESALLLADSGLTAVCVTHVNGFVNNGENEMPAEMRAHLEAHGVRVCTASHVLSGVERGISSRSGGMYPAEMIANTLRMFGQGLKVCVEGAVMALDAGLIVYGVPVIAIGGTGRGSDTAIILSPAHAQRIFETRIHEILCKPY